MSPYIVNGDPPELSDRFKVARSYGKATAAKGICDTDLTGKLGRTFIASEHADKSWGEFIFDQTQGGLTQLATLQATHGPVFHESVNLLIGRVIAHPWNEFMR